MKPGSLFYSSVTEILYIGGYILLYLGNVYLLLSSFDEVITEVINHSPIEIFIHVAE